MEYYMCFAFLDDELKSMMFETLDDKEKEIYVQRVVASLDLLEANIEEINADIVEIEDLYRYLWFLSFQKMAKSISEFDISDEEKERIERLSQSIKDRPKFFIKYINVNYKEVFDKIETEAEKWLKFKEVIFELIYNKYANGIYADVFDFIEKNYTTDILVDYGKYANYYKKHKDSRENLFLGLNATYVLGNRVYRNFLMNYKTNDQFFAKKAEDLCEGAIDFFKKIDSSADYKDILLLEESFFEYKRIAIRYRLKCANEYKECEKKVNSIIDEYWNKHGENINIGTCDLKKIISVLNERGEDRFLLLTHSKQDYGYENILTCEFNKNDYSYFAKFVEVIDGKSSINYPYYKQEAMGIKLAKEHLYLYVIFSDKKECQEFEKYVSFLSNSVQQEYFEDSINIVDEICGIFKSIECIVDLKMRHDEDVPFIKALVNGCVLNECGLIEKMLRNIAFNEMKDEEYFNEDSETLGSLLENHELKALSKGLKYYLRFYLSKENDNSIRKDERPGKDIRNVQMHNRGDKYQRTRSNLCFILFYFILSILGDLYYS